MDVTVFLAAIWGPTLCAVGLGVFLSRSYYVRIYRDIEKSAFAVLVFGMVAMAAGLAQMQLHAVWDTAPQVLISLLGWALFLKGAVFTIVPRLADRGGDFALGAKLVPLAGTLTLLAGAYLSYVAYLA
jgi:hypothetical protein